MKKNKQKQPINPPRKNDVDNYEVASNMRRISSYRNHRNSSRIDTATIDTPVYKQKTISSNDGYSKETTGIASLEYMRLEDQMSDYNTKNESAHENLRNDFERKIDNLSSEINNKLSISWFKWIIVGIASFVSIIVTIWVTFSYNPLIEDVEKIVEDMKPIEKRIDQINIQIEHIQNNLKELKISNKKE